MSQAPASFMRYETMREWLKDCGFSASEIRGMVEKGLIRGRLFSGKRHWYSAEQITNDVLQHNGKIGG